MVAEDGRAGLQVLRCEVCGDTFTLHEDDSVKCPTCGGGDAHPAHEPLL